jgi:hypothetical protein
MRGLLRSGLVWLALGLGAACSNIIGISDYEIDPGLDPQKDGDGGSGHEGGSSNHGVSAAPNAGHVSEGGESPSSGGSPSSAGSGQAGEPVRSDGGAGGAAPRECTPADCNDEIDCTVDSCDEDGACLHTADTSLCDADEDECLVCQVGIGCVAGEMVTQELLLDPAFDEPAGDWIEDIRYTEQASIITEDSAADSGGYSAWYLGVLDTATRQSYLDLLQYVTIPPNTKQLRLSGTYELYNGVKAPNDDYVVAGLFDGADEMLEFHQWTGDDPAASPWTAFEYFAPPAVLGDVLGLEVTFDIYGYSWDSEFYFDTLSLEASVCNQ